MCRKIVATDYLLACLTASSSACEFLETLYSEIKELYDDTDAQLATFRNLRQGQNVTIPPSTAFNVLTKTNSSTF